MRRARKPPKMPRPGSSRLLGSRAVGLLGCSLGAAQGALSGSGSLLFCGRPWEKLPGSSESEGSSECSEYSYEAPECYLIHEPDDSSRSLPKRRDVGVDVTSPESFPETCTRLAAGFVSRFAEPGRGVGT